MVRTLGSIKCDHRSVLDAAAKRRRLQGHNAGGNRVVINPSFNTAEDKSYSCWLEISEEKNVLFIRYEDLLSDFDACLSQISDELGLSAKNTSFTNIHSRADDWLPPELADPLDVNYYRDKKYVASLSPDEIALINEQLDTDLIKRMGYQEIHPDIAEINP